MTLTEYLQKSGETLDGYLARKKREQKGETTLSDYLARTRAEVATTDLSDIWGTLEKGGYIDRGTIRSYKTRLDDFIGKYSKVYNQSNEDARNYLENLKKLQEGVDSYDQYVSSFASDAAYEDFYKKTQLGKDLYDRATGAEDFGKYAGIGAAIQNPTMEEAEGKAAFFGGRVRIGAKDVGNIVTYSRDNNEAIKREMGIGRETGDGYMPVGDYRYSNFTDDEVSVYNYWLAKENEGSAAKGTAKAYLDAMDDVLNQREAGKVADRADGNMGLQLVFGVAAGLNQFAGGVQNMFRTGDGYIAPSLMDYASQYVREDLGDVGGQFLGNSTGQIAYDTVTTVANMLPSIMVSAMTGGTAGSVLGTSLMGFSAGGNYYREFLNSGMSKGQARALSVALGVWEGASEYYLGSIEGLGGKHASKLLNKTKLVSGLKSSASGFTRALMKVFDGVVDASTEGLEEVIQDIGSTIIKGTMTGEWEWSTLEEQAYSFTLGALSAAMMNAPGAVIGNTLQDADLYRNGKSIREMGGTEALRNLAVETANEYGGNDTLSRYAENVVKKPTAMNVGILNQRVNEARNQNNLRSIENALVEQMVSDGVEEKTAKKKSGKIAEKLLQEYNGEEIDLQKMLKDPSVKAVYDKVIRNADSEIGQREERHARAKQKIVQEYVQRGVAQAAAETEAGTLTGRFDTADGGRTVRNDTGEAVTIAATDAVASTDGGKLTLKLQNGETVSASDLSFGTKGEAVLYSVIADLGVSAETANKLLGVASGTDGEGLISVALGLRDAYWYGKKGVNYNALSEGTFTAGLAEMQRKTAYNLGKIDAVRETAGKAAAPAAKTADKTANLTKTAAKSTTAYPGEYRITDGKVPEVRNKNLNKLQKSGLSLAKVLSKLGADIYVYESTASGRQNGTANGYYLGADGSIHIDLNSGARGEGLVAYTLTHEFVHEMEQKSPELFRKYADLLFEELGNDNKSVTKMLEAEQARMRGMDEYKGLGDAKQKEIAYSEVVAKCSEKIFTDTDVLERFAARVAKADRTLLQKIVDFFQKIIDRLRGDYRGQRSNSTLGEVAVDTINRVTAIRDAFADAMADTVKSYQSEAVRAEKQTKKATEASSKSPLEGQETESHRYSLRDKTYEYSKEESESIHRDGNNRIATSYDDVLSFITSSVEGSEKGRLFLGKLNAATAKLIEEKSGISAYGKSLVLSGYEIKHIFNHHGNAQAEALRGQVAVTKNNFSAILDTIFSPDTVEAVKDQSGTLSLVFQKETKGKTTAVTVVSEKKKALTLKSAWITTKEQHISPPSDVQAPNQTPKSEWSMDTAPIHSITGRSEKINPSGENISEKVAGDGKDVRFSLRETDSEGKRLSDEQREYFDGTKVVDANGNLLRVYHGSPAVFTEFSYQFMGRNGSSEGQGIYFTQNKDMAEGYQRNGGQLLDGYLSIKKPLSDSKITLTPAEVKRLIQAIDPIGDDVIINYDSAGGMGYPSKTWYTRALADTVRSCMEYCDSDSEILANIANSGAGAKTVLLTAKRVLGYDGFIVDGKYENSTVYVAFTSEQFKNADNKKPTSSPDIRYSLREVEPVQPKSGAWERSLTTAEAKERFPHLWDVSAEESETRNPTQVKVTVSSYRKIYRYLRQKGFNGTILDASSGLGYGTRAGIEEFGFDVEDIEPYPGKNYSPKYTDYSALDKTYDVIISNAVLNVLPQDQRDALVVKMREMLNPGGTMFINVRGDDVLNASTKEIISKGNLEVYISNTGSYQKGFTQSELVGYLKDALGDGFTVESTDMFGKVSAIVTKDSVKQSTRETAENRKTGYSYEELVSKPDMKVTVLGDTAPANRADVVALAKKNAAKIGKFNAKDGSVSVYVKDAGADVILSKAGLIHSLDRRFSQNAPVTVKAGEILANSVVINELVPKNEKASASYVLIGAAGREGGSVQIVESVVNRFSNELLSMDVLYSINAKQKGTAALDAPPVFHPDYRSTISIAELLEFVNRYFPDILPEDVLRHYGYTERPGGVLGESALFSDRENVSARSLLANALESVAQNETEKEKLRQYKTKIGLMEQSEKQLTATKAKIRELSFSKGARDTEQIGRLRKTAAELGRRISKYDRQLFHLEASAPLKNVLSRESARVQKAEAARYREALNAYKKKTAETVRDIVQKNQESRKRAAEGRNKTEMRGKVKKVVGELNAYLKENKILIGMQKIVAEALDAVNMDTVGADARVAKYDALIAKETDPDVVRELQATRDRIAEQGETLKGRLERLKTAYADIINSDDPLIANAHDEVIENKIDDVIGKVGDTSIRDMTLEQLEEVYGMYRMILTSVRNANKVFLTNKAETITQLGEAVRGQVRATGGDHAREVAALRWLKKFGWKSLKPIYAMRMIGSETLTELYENVRSGEDAWYRDMSAAKAFREEQYKKHGYSGWDFGKRYRFTAKSGKTFEMTLEQILSLYAYAKRPQATEHLTKGGIVFDGAIEVTEKKHGVPVKYRVNTATAFNLSEEVIAEICGTLSPEQRAFADEMQAYLSEVMGEKGNEVSLALYGVKLFNEKTYFPLKSARQFLYQQNEVAGEVRIRNSGFSKATVAHANNPIILGNFMDVWAGHCNDMAMYHSFVLPLEDFNRVWNYKTKTDDKAETSSVKQALQNAYGTGVNEYISTLLTDLNGGARQSGAEEIGKLMSLAKKGAVFASASVTIQQPSAICRAMAYISPKYFAKTFAQAFNFRQHRAVWEECKKYAPVAGIKEMGYFDTGMGKGSVDWLKAEAPEGLRNKIAAFLKDGSYRDEVLSKAPSMADELTWCYIWNATKALVADTTDLSGETLLTEAGRKFTQVITLTQVYDSVLSRSGLMRSKDTGMKMATAFMAEPTTTMNMVADAFVRGRRIGGKQGAKIISGAVGAVTASIVLNSLLKAVVVAWRHIGDDDDETYAEKYGKAALEDFLDNFNPLTYIPFAKDIVSLCQGYDVSRMDMDLFEDLVSALKSIDSGTKSAYQKVTAIIGAVSAFFGIPFRNIERDLRPIVQKLIGAA